MPVLTLNEGSGETPGDGSIVVFDDGHHDTWRTLTDDFRKDQAPMTLVVPGFGIGRVGSAHEGQVHPQSPDGADSWAAVETVRELVLNSPANIGRVIFSGGQDVLLPPALRPARDQASVMLEAAGDLPGVKVLANPLPRLDHEHYLSLRLRDLINPREPVGIVTVEAERSRQMAAAKLVMPKAIITGFVAKAVSPSPDFSRRSQSLPLLVARTHCDENMAAVQPGDLPSIARVVGHAVHIVETMHTMQTLGRELHGRTFGKK